MTTIIIKVITEGSTTSKRLHSGADNLHMNTTTLTLVPVHTEEEPVPLFEPPVPSVRQRIALVAHDNMKPSLLEWAEHNEGILRQHDLIGTGTTGRLVSERLDTPVELLLSGPLGGDQQVGAMIANQAIDLLVFFWDPMEPQPHDPDVRALLRLAVVWNIPVACNRATADHLISSPLFLGDYTPETPDYSVHENRDLQPIP